MFFSALAATRQHKGLEAQEQPITQEDWVEALMEEIYATEEYEFMSGDNDDDEFAWIEDFNKAEAESVANHNQVRWDYLEYRSIRELKKLCALNNLPKYSYMRKNELIKYLIDNNYSTHQKP